MDWSKTTLYDPKPNSNIHSRNTFLIKKIDLKNVLWKWMLLGWLLTSSVSRNAGYFDKFEQVKNLSYRKTLLGETGRLSNFLGYLSMSPALYPGFSDL